MIKKLTISTITLLMVSTVGFASPLTDFSQGKTSVDITWRPSVNIKDKWVSGNDSRTKEYDGKKATLDWRITSGLGDNWAIQYNQYNAISDPTNFDIGVKTQELDVLYKLNKNTSIFAGYHQAKFNYTAIHNTVVSQNKKALQVGLIENAEIAAKTNIYGIVGFGKDLANYEAGISYEFAKNTELNISYRYKKVKALHDTFTDSWGSTDYKDDVTAKGFGYGITYKF